MCCAAWSLCGCRWVGHRATCAPHIVEQTTHTCLSVCLYGIRSRDHGFVYDVQLYDARSDLQCAHVCLESRMVLAWFVGTRSDSDSDSDRQAISVVAVHAMFREDRAWVNTRKSPARSIESTHHFNNLCECFWAACNDDHNDDEASVYSIFVRALRTTTTRMRFHEPRKRQQTARTAA